MEGDMKKEFHDPFSETKTDSTLPPRGTGLTTNTAGERRGGNPRTETERKERHKEVMDDSSSKGEFVKVVKDGVTSFRRKGYEDAEMPAPSPKSVSDQWKDYHAKGRK